MTKQTPTESLIMKHCSQMPTKGVVTPVQPRKPNKTGKGKKKKQTKLLKSRGVPPHLIGPKPQQLTPTTSERETGINSTIAFVTREETLAWYKLPVETRGPDPRGKAPSSEHFFNYGKQEWQYYQHKTLKKKPRRLLTASKKP